jgi:hypothetical protein
MKRNKHSLSESLNAFAQCPAYRAVTPSVKSKAPHVLNLAAFGNKKPEAALKASGWREITASTIKLADLSSEYYSSMIPPKLITGFSE